jgi:hypothetical protein
MKLTKAAVDKAQKKIERTTLRQAFKAYMRRRILKPQTVFDIGRVDRLDDLDWSVLILPIGMFLISGSLVLLANTRGERAKDL